MSIQKLKTTSLLLIIACGFTACSALQPDAYDNGQQPIKEDSALVFASTTAQDIGVRVKLLTFEYCYIYM